MRRVQTAATGLTLAIAFLFRPSWCKPLLVANSIAGAIYMAREATLLQTVGSVRHGFRIRLTPMQNVAVNVLFHGVLTLLALRRLDNAPVDWRIVSLLELIGILVIDFDAVYPTARGIEPYVMLHIFVLIAFLLAC